MLLTYYAAFTSIIYKGLVWIPCPRPPSWRRGANSHIKMTGVLVVPFRGKNKVLVALRVFKLKKAIAGTFAMPFRIPGAVSRKPRKLFGSVKPLQNLEPCEYRTVLVAYSKDDGRFPSYKKFQAYTLLRF